MVRLTCSQCQRPAGLCYCDSIRPVANSTAVSIIQHPLEQEHPFNTGRIAHLALNKCKFIVAEQLNANDCQQVITASSVLLYPDLDWLPPVPPIPDNIDNLIVLDASWRKSKKMLHLNPALQALPRLSLSELGVSNYKVRTTSLPDGLATIEAIYYALNSLEPEVADDLLLPFQTMVQRQLAMAESQKQS